MPMDEVFSRIEKAIAALLQLAVGLGIFIGLGIAVASYNGIFGQTGSDYFRSCWEKRAAAINTRLDEPRAASPEQAIAWARCEITTRRAIYDRGIVFAGTPQDAIDQAIDRACPSGLRDLPLGGSYMLTVKLAEENGGPKFLDRFMPAEHMIGRLWTERWPACSAEREKHGYPKIVERGNSFGWAWNCPRCK